MIKSRQTDFIALQNDSFTDPYNERDVFSRNLNRCKNISRDISQLQSSAVIDDKLTCVETQVESHFLQDFLTKLNKLEKKYYEQLMMIINEFLVPLRRLQTVDKKHKSSWKKFSCTTIFSNIETLQKFSLEIISILDFSSSSVADISAFFFSIAPYFRLFVEYCKNYGQSMYKLDRVLTSNGYLSQKIQKLQGNDLSLRKLLSAPLRHVCDYFTLLKQLVSLKECVNFQELQNAVEVMFSVIEEIVSSVKDQGMKVQMHQLFVDLGGIHGQFPDLFQPCRQLKEVVAAKLLFVAPDEDHFSLDNSDVDCKLLIFTDIVAAVKINTKRGLMLLLKLSMEDIYANYMEKDVGFYIVQIQPTLRRYVFEFSKKIIRDRVYSLLCNQIIRHEQKVVDHNRVSKLINQYSAKHKPYSLSLKQLDESKVVLHQNWGLYWTSVMNSLRRKKLSSPSADNCSSNHSLNQEKFVIMGSGILFAKADIKEKVKKNLIIQSLSSFLQKIQKERLYA